MLWGHRRDGGTGEPRAKAFTHGGGRGNGSFTGGGLRALEEPVHQEAPVLAAAAPAAGVGLRARAQDPVAADALRSREAASGQGPGVPGVPVVPGVPSPRTPTRQRPPTHSSGESGPQRVPSSTRPKV